MEVGERFELRFGGDTYYCYVESAYVTEPILAYHPMQPFSMRDPKWRNVPLLHSTYTLGNAGCAMVSAAMIISQVDPEITPEILNAALLDAHLADNGLLLWESIPPQYEGVVYDGPATRWEDGDLIWHDVEADLDRVKAELERGPCIMEVDYHPGGKYDSHFVVALLYEEGPDDILIIDSLDGEEVWLKDRYGKRGWDLGRAIYGLRLLRVKE